MKTLTRGCLAALSLALAVSAAPVLAGPATAAEPDISVTVERGGHAAFDLGAAESGIGVRVLDAYAGIETTVGWRGYGTPTAHRIVGIEVSPLYTGDGEDLRVEMRGQDDADVVTVSVVVPSAPAPLTGDSLDLIEAETGPGAGRYTFDAPNYIMPAHWVDERGCEQAESVALDTANTRPADLDVSLESLPGGGQVLQVNDRRVLTDPTAQVVLASTGSFHCPGSGPATGGTAWGSNAYVLHPRPLIENGTTIATVTPGGGSTYTPTTGPDAPVGIWASGYPVDLRILDVTPSTGVRVSPYSNGVEIALDGGFTAEFARVRAVISDENGTSAPSTFLIRNASYGTTAKRSGDCTAAWATVRSSEHTWRLAQAATRARVTATARGKHAKTLAQRALKRASARHKRVAVKKARKRLARATGAVRRAQRTEQAFRVRESRAEAAWKAAIARTNATCPRTP